MKDWKDNSYHKKSKKTQVKQKLTDTTQSAYNRVQNKVKGK